MTDIRPVDQLVPDASGLLALAERAYQAAKAQPDDPLPTLSCFIFAYHLKDWRRREHGGEEVERRFFSDCPFAGTLQELTNGAKHLVLTPGKAKSAGDVHVQETRLVAGYGQGAYGVGPYGRPYIAVTTRRSADQPERDYSALAILREALDWWGAELAA